MKRPPRYNRNIVQDLPLTLIIDGNALLNVAYHGAKNVYSYDGKHIGGIYQFYTILRKLIIESDPTKIFIFWDGKFSGRLRYELYNQYKANRDKNFLTDHGTDDPDRESQKIRIKQYAEELFIRQYEDEIIEADDCIAYYCNTMSDHERILICTGDQDICQLLSETVKIYFLPKKKYLSIDNYLSVYDHHHENLTLVKTIIGDNSDNIKGIKGVKEKTLLKLVPELVQKKMTLSEIFIKLKEENSKRKKPLKVIDNILNGVTDGVQKNKFYEINDKIINLKNPLLTLESINNLNIIIDSKIDPEGRNMKNLFKMMNEDGFMYEIPGGENGYINYLLPFTAIIKKEKKFFNSK